MYGSSSGSIPRVIALSGWKGSGKDTLAQYLVSQYEFTQLSFAARLKDLVANMYRLSRESLDSPAAKEAPLPSYPATPTDAFSEAVHTLLRSELRSGCWTPRALCILIGSMARSVDPNYWVRSVAETILANPENRYVISDMRYKSEADTLRLLIPELVTIRINRFETIDTLDPSERDLDTYKFNYYVGNQGSLEELHAQVDSLLFHHSTSRTLGGRRD